MLKEIDQIETAVTIAFINRKVNSTKQQGKKQVYVVTKMSDIFDKEKAEQEVLGEVKDSGAFQRLRKITPNLDELKEKGTYK